MSLEENALQSKCFIWAWNAYPSQRRMLFHINNKAKNAIEGSKFKAMGVVKGVADMELICPNGGIVWIEMKVEKGRQRKEQKEFQEKVEKRGHIYLIERTEEGFKNIIRFYWGPEEDPYNDSKTLQSGIS